MTEVAALMKASPRELLPNEAVLMIEDLRALGYTLRSTTTVRESSISRTKRIMKQISKSMVVQNG